MQTYRNPAPTTDVIIYDAQTNAVVLIERVNPPHGYALPGGFVDYGEKVEDAAVREMREETGLDITLKGLLGVYSKPDRDPRFHTISVVYVGEAVDTRSLCAGDDAASAAFFPLNALPKMAFDHHKILQDFKEYLLQKRYLASLDES